MNTFIFEILSTVVAVLACAMTICLAKGLQFIGILFVMLGVEAWNIFLACLAPFVLTITLKRLTGWSPLGPLKEWTPAFSVSWYRFLTIEGFFVAGVLWLNNTLGMGVLDDHPVFGFPTSLALYPTLSLLIPVARAYRCSNGSSRWVMYYLSLAAPLATLLVPQGVNWLPRLPVSATYVHLVMLVLALLACHLALARRSISRTETPLDASDDVRMEDNEDPSNPTPDSAQTLSADVESGGQPKASVKVTRRRPLRMSKESWLRIQRTYGARPDPLDSTLPFREIATLTPNQESPHSPEPLIAAPPRLAFRTPPATPKISPPTRELPPGNQRLPGSFDRESGGDSGETMVSSGRRSFEVSPSQQASLISRSEASGGDVGDKNGSWRATVGPGVAASEGMSSKEEPGEGDGCETMHGGPNPTLLEAAPPKERPEDGVQNLRREQLSTLNEPSAEDEDPLPTATPEHPRSPRFGSTPTLGDSLGLPVPVAQPEPSAYHPNLDTPTLIDPTPAPVIQVQDRDEDLDLGGSTPAPADANKSNASSPQITPTTEIPSPHVIPPATIMPQSPSLPPTPEFAPMEITWTGPGVTTGRICVPQSNKGRVVDRLAQPADYPWYITAMLGSLATWFGQAAKAKSHDSAPALAANMEVDQAEPEDEDMENGSDDEDMEKGGMNDEDMEEDELGDEDMEVEVPAEVAEVEMQELAGLDTPMGSPALEATGTPDTAMGSPLLEPTLEYTGNVEPTADIEIPPVDPTAVATTPEDVSLAFAPIPASAPLSRRTPHVGGPRKASKVTKSRLHYWTASRPTKPNKPRKRHIKRAQSTSTIGQAVPSLWVDAVCKATFVEWKATGFVPQFIIPHRPSSWMSQIVASVDELASAMQQAMIDGTPLVSTPTGQPEELTPAVVQGNIEPSIDEQLARMLEDAMNNIQAETNEVATNEAGQEALSGSAPGHEVDTAQGQGSVDSDEDGEDQEGGMGVELDGGDDAAAEAYLNDLLPELLGAGLP